MVVGAGFKPARNRNHIQKENQREKRMLRTEHYPFSILNLYNSYFLKHLSVSLGFFIQTQWIST